MCSRGCVRPCCRSLPDTAPRLRAFGFVTGSGGMAILGGCGNKVSHTCGLFKNGGFGVKSPNIVSKSF